MKRVMLLTTLASAMALRILLGNEATPSAVKHIRLVPLATPALFVLTCAQLPDMVDVVSRKCR
jgi:hypothetical protein